MRSLPFRALCASLSLVLTAGMAVARTAPAQTPAPMPATTKPVTLSATIEAIDKSTRMITLKGPQGNLASVYADSSVKRFDELKVGDTAPDFTLKASDGQTYTLSKLRGKTVVLAWFPKAFTAG